MKKFTINEFRDRYPDDDSCLRRIFELRYTNLVCPKCENDKPFKRVKNRRSYQCPCCGFQLYPTQGTVFEKTTTPLTHWFYAIFLQTTTRNGVAAKELERQLDICYKTALRMNHHIKMLMANKSLDPFTGIVELDEAYIGAKLPFLQNKKRKELDKQFFKSPKFNKTTIFGMLERGGRVFAQVIPQLTGENIDEIVNSKVDPSAQVYTDTSNLYARLKITYKHDSVNHGQREWARGECHINSIESFWTQVKRTIKGTHIHVSERHMQKYLDEISFRWEHKNNQDTMFETILSHVV